MGIAGTCVSQQVAAGEPCRQQHTSHDTDCQTVSEAQSATTAALSSHYVHVIATMGALGDQLWSACALSGSPLLIFRYIVLAILYCLVNKPSLSRSHYTLPRPRTPYGLTRRPRVTHAVSTPPSIFLYTVSAAQRPTVSQYLLSVTIIR